MYPARSSLLDSIPPVTLNLLIINVLSFLATLVFANNGVNLNALFGLHYWEASSFNLIQLFTYMFLHANFQHLLFNMFPLFMFGRTLEQIWGSGRFLLFYLVTGVGAALVQELVWSYQVWNMLNQENIQLGQYILTKSEFIRQYMTDYMNYAFLTVGASGAIFGILLGFGMLFPNANLYLLFIPFPIKAKYFVIGYGLIELFLGISNFKGDPIAHFAHLGGMIFGFILIKIWRKQDFNNGKYFY